MIFKITQEENEENVRVSLTFGLSTHRRSSARLLFYYKAENRSNSICLIDFFCVFFICRTEFSEWAGSGAEKIKPTLRRFHMFCETLTLTAIWGWVHVWLGTFPTFPLFCSSLPWKFEDSLVNLIIFSYIFRFLYQWDWEASACMLNIRAIMEIIISSLFVLHASKFASSRVPILIIESAKATKQWRTASNTLLTFN